MLTQPFLLLQATDGSEWESAAYNRKIDLHILVGRDRACVVRVMSSVWWLPGCASRPTSSLSPLQGPDSTPSSLSLAAALPD